MHMFARICVYCMGQNFRGTKLPELHKFEDFVVETVDVPILRKFREQLMHTVYNLFNTSNLKKIQKTMQN